MRRSPAITVATLATAALALSACGRGAGTAASNEQAKDISSGKATGAITVWAMGAEGDKLPELAKEFEAANPGVKVKVTAIPWDAAHDKFATAIAAGKTPDVAWSARPGWASSPSPARSTRRPSVDRQGRFFPGARRPPRWTARRTASRGTSRPGSSTTAPTWPRRPAITTPPGRLGRTQGDGQGHGDQGRRQVGHQPPPGGTGSWQTFLPFAWSNGADAHQRRRQGLHASTPPR